MSLGERANDDVRVRCECRACGCHLVGSLTSRGVRGRCGICASDQIELVRAPGAGGSLADLGLLAEAPRIDGALALD